MAACFELISVDYETAGYNYVSVYCQTPRPDYRRRPTWLLNPKRFDNRTGIIFVIREGLGTSVGARNSPHYYHHETGSCRCEETTNITSNQLTLTFTDREKKYRE